MPRKKADSDTKTVDTQGSSDAPADQMHDKMGKGEVKTDWADPVVEPVKADSPDKSADNSVVEPRQKGDPDFKVTEPSHADRKDLPDSSDDDFRHDLPVDEPQYVDRSRRLRDEVNVNGSSPGKGDPLVDAVGQIAKGLGYTKGIDARQDVIGREALKGKVTDGDRSINFGIQVDRQLDPVRFNPANWDKARGHKRGDSVDSVSLKRR